MAIQPYRPVRVSIGGTASGSNAARQMKQIEGNFINWTRHLKAQSGEVLLEALGPTLAKAKKYCPHRTGVLRSSGYLEVRRIGAGNAFQAEIGFGRGGVPTYAIYVHETPIYHAPPTRWKFLQTALEEDGSQIRSKLVSGMVRAAGV